mgnify:FL=1
MHGCAAARRCAQGCVGLFQGADTDAHLYEPIAGGPEPMWKCVGSDHVIPWAQVNDDYCDCPDGSDEPGTSACPNMRFYCANAGFIPSYIRSSRVNDGLCGLFLLAWWPAC